MRKVFCAPNRSSGIRDLTLVNRQGVLPFPRFWASTRPFGTPLGPYLIKWAMTILMILAPPAGDAFNFSMPIQFRRDSRPSY